MDMVRCNVPFLDIDVQRFTGLTDQFAQAFPDLTRKIGLRYFVIQTRWYFRS